jgi:hypothetical protein
MPEAVAYGLLIVFPLIGALSRRWLAVVLPLVAWPSFYLGLNRGWWLNGTGDGWQALARFFTLVGVVTTALAVLSARNMKPPSRQRRFAKLS